MALPACQQPGAPSLPQGDVPGHHRPSIAASRTFARTLPIRQFRAAQPGVVGGCPGWPSEPRPPACPGNPYRLALVAAARSLDEDRVSGVRVLSWLDVEIGQRGDQPLPLRSIPEAGDGQSVDPSGSLQLLCSSTPALRQRYTGHRGAGLTVAGGVTEARLFRVQTCLLPCSSLDCTMSALSPESASGCRV